MQSAAVEVVLVRPQIPPNVGNAARTCAAFGLPLHLVGPSSVRLDDPSLRRAGVDTWSQLEIHRHDHLAEVVALTAGRAVAFTTGAAVSLVDFVFTEGDLLVFGPEATGLEPADLQGVTAETVRIPQGEQIRSLNLATCVGIGSYAALLSLGRLYSSSSMA